MDVVEFTDERGSTVDRYTGTYKNRINCNGSSAIDVKCVGTLTWNASQNTYYTAGSDPRVKLKRCTGDREYNMLPA